MCITMKKNNACIIIICNLHWRFVFSPIIMKNKETTTKKTEKTEIYIFLQIIDYNFIILIINVTKQYIDKKNKYFQ